MIVICLERRRDSQPEFAARRRSQYYSLTVFPSDRGAEAKMSEYGSDTLVAEPAVKKNTRRQSDEKRQPRYHVILWDDDDHSYEYVILMMRQLFGFAFERGFVIAKTVDTDGRAVCLTTTKEHAELKRDQIHAFGRDMLIDRCEGSMSATIEPESDA